MTSVREPPVAVRRLSPTPTSRAQKSGDGVLGADIEPLTKRFAELGTPVKVHWKSGTLGSDAAPGPSSYWIDAVVEGTNTVVLLATGQ